MYSGNDSPSQYTPTKNTAEPFNFEKHHFRNFAEAMPQAEEYVRLAALKQGTYNITVRNNKG